MTGPDPSWRQFEESVAAFVAALDPSATVRSDVRLADKHTGSPRQRDVWIEAKLMEHFPVRVLVSCKRLARKLDSGHIDAFSGELQSSGAAVGVLYSFSGFSKPAIEKGRTLGISCCQLFQGDRPAIPELLYFTAYCCTPQIRVQIEPACPSGWETAKWNDLFDIVISTARTRRPLLDSLVDRYHEAETAAVASIQEHRGVPQPFASSEVAVPAYGAKAAVVVRAIGQWKFYQAKIEAYAVKGSYEFTHGDFKGEIATPSVDRLSSEPGPGWERLDAPPERPPSYAMIIMHRGNAKEALREALGPNTLCN